MLQAEWNVKALTLKRVYFALDLVIKPEQMEKSVTYLSVCCEAVTKCPYQHVPYTP